MTRTWCLLLLVSLAGCGGGAEPVAEAPAEPAAPPVDQRVIRARAECEVHLEVAKMFYENVEADMTEEERAFAMTNLIKTDDPKANERVDPWNRPWLVVATSAGFKVVSVGPDGRPRTDDDIGCELAQTSPAGETGDPTEGG